MAKWIQKIQRRTAQLLEVPYDIALNLPRIILISNLQLYIENHHGIFFFSTERLVIELPKGKLVIIGENMVLRTILPQEIMLEGKIKSVTYED